MISWDLVPLYYTQTVQIFIHRRQMLTFHTRERKLKTTTHIQQSLLREETRSNRVRFNAEKSIQEQNIILPYNSPQPFV